MNLRKATINDIEQLIALRFDYFKLDGIPVTAEEKNTIEQQLRSYFKQHIADGTFMAIFAEADAKVVCAAYMFIIEKPATPYFLSGKVGSIINVLTYPEYRRQGFATKVLQMLINEAQKLGLSSLELAATSDGKPLYEKLGFNSECRCTAMRMPLY